MPILYTQGETASPASLATNRNVPNVAASRPHAATARMLKPLLEALTTTGSGRLEIIKDAFERGVVQRSCGS